MLIPPPNYSLFEKNIYRSGIPMPMNLPFLEKLQLKKIVFINHVSEYLEAYLLAFIESHRIELTTLVPRDSVISNNVYNPNNNSQSTISEDTLVAACNAIVNHDTEQQPLLIMCSSGKQKTGMVVACLRKLQGWNLVSILTEYRRFNDYKVKLQNEQQIELFDIDLVSLPDKKPAWIPQP